MVRPMRGHLSPRFLPLYAFGVSISRHIEWGIGPRDNVFPGPAVALYGHGYFTYHSLLSTEFSGLECPKVYGDWCFAKLPQTPPGRVGYSAVALPQLSIWLYRNEMRGEEGERGRGRSYMVWVYP